MFTRLQGGVNLQVCLLNDSSSSDKDSDAEDCRTETSLDTPLSPLVLGADNLGADNLGADNLRTCCASLSVVWSSRFLEML